jgi:hypothetical protein
MAKQWVGGCGSTGCHGRKGLVRRRGSDYHKKVSRVFGEACYPCRGRDYLFIWLRTSLNVEFTDKDPIDPIGFVSSTTNLIHIGLGVLSYMVW